jgi:hypothetical protein
MLKPYIDFNTAQRARHRNDECKKDVCKLANNSVFGKFIENLAKRSDIKLLRDYRKARKLAEKPHCIDWELFARNLIGVEMRKIRQVINRPFYVSSDLL